MNSAQKKTIFILFGIAVCVFDFFYIHWISYQMALSHEERELYIPLTMAVLSAIGYAAIKIMERKDHKKIFAKYILVILFIGCVVAFQFRGFCPACNEVQDPIYKYLFQVFKGAVYTYGG